MFLKRDYINDCFCDDSIRLSGQRARFAFIMRRELRCSGEGSVGLTIIEPVPEAVEAILYKIFRRSKVEPRIDCL